MDIYIIAQIKDTRNNLIGYRVLDKNSGNILNVTKNQIIYANKARTIKLLNAKVQSNSIKGIYSSLTEFPVITIGSHINDIVALNIKDVVAIEKVIYKDMICAITVSDINGHIKTVKPVQIKELIQKVRCVNMTVDFNNGILEVKCNKIEGEEADKFFREETIKERKAFISDEEARDPKVVWDIDRFVAYMNQKGYKYNLGRNILSHLDVPSDAIIHLPKGIKVLANCFTSGKSIDTLIVSSTVTRILNPFIDSTGKQIDNVEVHARLFTINNIYIQDFCRESENDNKKYELNNIKIMKNLRFIDVEYKSDFSNKVTLENVFKYCDIYCDIEFNSCIESVYSSFSRCNIYGNVNLNNLKVIIRSFTETDIHGRLTLGDTIHIVSFSFNHYTENKKGRIALDIKSNSIKKIEKSFLFNNVDINKIDLNDTPNLHTIIGAFNFNTETYVQNVNPNINSRRVVGSFKNIVCDTVINMHDFQIGAILTSFEKCKVNIINTGCNKVIKHEDTEEYELIRDIPDFIEELQERALSNCRVSNLKNNVRIIHPKGLAYIIVTNKDCSIDTSDMPNVSVLEEEVIYNANIKSICIDNNIRIIENNAISRCGCLEKICISDKVEEISEDAFSDLGASNNTLGNVRVYCVRGSYADKFLTKISKKNKFSINRFDTFEQAKDAFAGVKTIKEASLNLIKEQRVLYEEGSLRAKLADDKYIDNFNELKKIGKIFDNFLNKYRTDARNELAVEAENFDTSKYFSKNPVNINETPLCVITDASKKGNFIYSEKFAGLVHFFYVVSKNNNLMGLVDNIINKIGTCEDKKKIAWELNSVVIKEVNKNGRINAILSIRDKSIKIPWGILVVVADNNIVMCIPYSTRKGGMSGTLYNNNITGSDIDAFTNVVIEGKIGCKITEGDYGNGSTYYDTSEDNTIGGMLTPYGNLMYHIIKNNFIILDYYNSSTSGKFKARTINNKNKHVLAYDTVSRRFILMDCIIEVNEHTRIVGVKSTCEGLRQIDKIRGFVVLKTIECDKLAKNIGGISTEFITNIFNSEEVQLSSLYGQTKDELKALVRNKDAYYKVTNVEDTLKIAEELKSNNIYKIDDITKEQLLKVLNGRLCTYFKDTCVNDILAKAKKIDTYKVGDCKVQDISVSRNTSNLDIHFIAIMEPFDTVLKEGVYMSLVNINSLIQCTALLNIGLIDKEEHLLDSEPVNTDDFVFLTTECSQTSYSWYTVNYSVAVQRKTLEIFILATNDDISYYKLLRLDNMFNAEVLLYNKYMDSRIINDIDIVNLYDLVSYEHNNEYINYDKISVCCKVRRLIIEGAPSGYTVPDNMKAIFSLVSKQPGKLTDKFN